MNVGTIVLHEIDKKTAERYLGYGTSSAEIKKRQSATSATERLPQIRSLPGSSENARRSSSRKFRRAMSIKYSI